MASRLCGYCRLSGHRADKCDIKLNHIKEALSHTPKERKFILDTMPKFGFGLGATFRMRNWYNNSDLICTITGHEWISDLQFTNYKKIKYSKQVKLTNKESFTRIGDSVMSADNQYGAFNMTALVVDNGDINEESLHIRYGNIIRAKDLDPAKQLSSGETALVSPSYQPYPYTLEDLVRNVYLPSRLSDKEPFSRWSDFSIETGILT